MFQKSISGKKSELLDCPILIYFFPSGFRFKQKTPLPWMAINACVGVLVITFLVGHIFHAAITRIAKVEADYRTMVELKARAEAADVAKSQVLFPFCHLEKTFLQKFRIFFFYYYYFFNATFALFLKLLYRTCC